MNIRLCKKAVMSFLDDSKTPQTSVKFHLMFWVCMIFMMLICISLSAILWDYLYYSKMGYKSFILGGPEAPELLRFVQTASTMLACLLIARPFGKLLKKFGLIKNLTAKSIR